MESIESKIHFSNQNYIVMYVHISTYVHKSGTPVFQNFRSSVLTNQYFYRILAKLIHDLHIIDNQRKFAIYFSAINNVKQVICVDVFDH